MPNEPVTDPFVDDQFSRHDLSNSPKSLTDALGTIAEEHPEFAPTAEEVIAADGAPEPVIEPAPAPVVAPVAPVVTPAQPETYSYPDGSTVTLIKGSKGWCATLESGGKAPEKFYGRTKDELLTNVLAAKLHATQHIRELNRKLKLTAKPKAEAPAQTPPPRTTPLTADEIYEIKSQLDTNPDLALDGWFQRKFGLKAEELLNIVEEGRHAKEELQSEAVSKAFLAAHPDYYPDPEYQNYLTIVALLSKEKLGKTMDASSDDDIADIMRALIRGGHWTVENLGEAFEELAEAGLLLAAPEEELEEEIPPVVEPVVPVVVAPPAAPPPAIPAPAPPTTALPPRIASRRVGQRAGLGIRASDVSTTVPVTERPPSADELDNLTDSEISELFSGVRRAAATRR